MGSLPNLHELEHVEGGKECQSHFKPGPALGHLCGTYDADLTNEEKSRILHRYSGHARITKVRSNPHDSHRVVQDDVVMEHMTAYSPVSRKSHLNLHCTGSHMKRIDSLASSIGATSVRRLLTVVRGGGPHKNIERSGGILHNRKLLITNLFMMCLCHLLSTAALMSFLSLQSSVSVWVRSNSNDGFEVNVGSLLSSEIFFVAAVAALVAPYCVRLLGATIVAVICHVGMGLFYASHLYPVLYITISASFFMGVFLGLLSNAHISFLIILTQKITALFHEEDEDCIYSRRTCIIRRAARGFQGAHDLGIMLGSVLSFLVIHLTFNPGSGFSAKEMENASITIQEYSSITSLNCYMNNTILVTLSTSEQYEYSQFLDELFDQTEEGRLCGSQACPVFSTSANLSFKAGFRVLPDQSSKILIGIYSGACGLAFLIAMLGMDNIAAFLYPISSERDFGLNSLRAVRESFRDMRLLLTAPLAVFVGLEQAFIYGVFTKSYVVCTLGIHRVNLVILAMGLLQSIAAVTLSMLLRTIRRYYVMGVGLIFQICLIMVLLLWKPIEDDPALFYVISAAWGVCHAIWEMIAFTLLTGHYLDNWEAAFANRAFFKFIGFSIAFLLQSFLCNYVKLYLLAFVMVAAVIPFAILEYRLENLRKLRNITRL
ncbi:uncharacterized protein LOC126745047 [Anthonomus grandis grandis]|uniref:uncharacterized protein LOC126745047 n=1 Tax=Anthonomus grandis grandis TaxID=2921223 RepID=UPI002164FD7E|nr:uncharacterized protein LOC126745047 [Anthonomus grandis grandis]